jgi:hypothetical protein
MIFIEKLKLFSFLRLLCTGQEVRYGTRSFGARTVAKVAAGFGLSINARKIDFCDVLVARNIRRNAYRAAELCIEILPGKGWADSLSPVLKVNFWLIVQKFIFDELYFKFEFVEMALRFAEENPNEAHAITVDKEYLGPYVARLNSNFALNYSRNTTGFGLCAILLLPLFVEYFWWKKGEAGKLRHDNCIVCEVDGEKTLEMFSSIFSNVAPGKLAFVIEQRNSASFDEARLQKLGIGVLGLRNDGVRYLRQVVWKYISQSFFHIDAVRNFGSRLFWIFYVLMRGRADVIEGSGNAYCTYEHLELPKTVRNEFLKSAENKTIFIPMNAHVTPQYYHAEIKVNYDVMCSAGQHTEFLYRKKHALTDVYLPTGSYDSHRGSVQLSDKSERLARLKAFKEDFVAITIVSPGICDPTYGHEVKLMRLACLLSNTPGVRVFVRLKPVPPEPKYADFYEKHTAGCPNVLLTSGEYELFDFLEISDLVVTSISNAAYDLAQAGAQVMFVDYLKDPDLTLAWSAVEGVLLSEHSALPTILKWIDNDQQFRAVWAGKMTIFSEYIGFQFPDFEAYRSNLLTQLSSVNLGGRLFDSAPQRI